MPAPPFTAVSSPGGPTQVVVIDDNRDALTALRMLLEDEDMVVRSGTSPSALPTLLAERTPDVVLLDMNFSRDVVTGEEGFTALDALCQKAPSVAVVLMTAYGDVDRAVRALKAGAVDFVEKPWSNPKLVATVHAAAEIARSRRRADRAEARADQAEAQASGLASVLSGDIAATPLLGESEAMRRLRRAVERVAPTEADVLILGENGTGKELVAREVHRLSSRAQGPLVRVDLGAIPEALAESELFGAEKGAYTGADETRIGRAEIADGGTLFLDEIGNVSLAIQTKLLSLLERREIVRLGSTTSRPVDLRLVSATNAPLDQMAATGAFRRDLLFRINSFVIEIPPLRERGLDVVLLANHFLSEYATRYRRPLTGLSPEASDALLRHDWPGNVRELRHAIERAVILAPEDASVLPDAGMPGLQGTREAPGQVTLSNGVQHDGAGSMLDRTLKETERDVIKRALARTGWNVSQAARELGLTRRSLYRRIEEHRL